jgi:signal transduction histidine kinase/CheY-like chemotaxis protein
MGQQRNIARLFLYGSIVVIFILTLTILAVFIFDKYLNFGKDLQKIEKQFTAEQNQLVQAKVNELIDYIDYNKSQAEQILKENVKERTYYAWSIAWSIYNANKDIKKPAEIKRLIKEILRPIRFFKDRGYYFIDNLAGNFVLHPPNSDREGDSALNEADINGKYMVRDFIEIVKARGEGYSSYYTLKIHEKQEVPGKKISFVKLFEPYQWILGTGEYVEDVEKDLQEKVKQRIQTLRFGKDQKEYAFLLQIHDMHGADYFATTLINPKLPNLVNKKIGLDYQDTKGNEFMRAAAAQLLKNGEAIVTYWFEKPDNAKITQKTSYFRWYKDWNWLIGAGFHHDDLQTLISQRKQKLGQAVLKEIYLIVGIFILISFLATLTSRFIAGKIKREFDVYANFFKESAIKNELLDKNRLHVNEFRELADCANRMITDKKQGEEALLKAKETAEAATRARSEFLANVSHEIRTPMNAIIGMSDILAQTALSDEQYEYLEIINTSANTLLVIIDDILDFSKIEAGRINIDRINFSIREVIEGAADMLAPKAHAKGLELITLIEPEIPAQVLGDSSRLHQILLNLVNNAVKFTDLGEIVISAEMAPLEENEVGVKVLFKIRDTGIGISEQDQAHLFKTFSQLDTTSTRKYGGTGLGLAISRKLSQLMGGEIGVKSREGQGATFWFICLFEPALESTTITPVSTMDFKKLKILIVDDNRTNRLIVRKYLEVWECRCEEAENAWQAMEILRRAKKNQDVFDVVLVDFQMPEVSGVELAEMIKGDKTLRDLPLILLSSSTMHQTHEELREYGFADILYKPIKQFQLSRSIGQVLGIAKPGEDSKRRATKKPLEIPDQPLDILLVEDNVFNQKVAIFNLQKFNHRVELAENGKIAIEKFKTQPYDLVLMDVQMPVMDGYEATRTIRALEREKSRQTGIEIHTPIVAMTANAMKDDEEKAFDSGMDAHLAKPFSAEKLIGIIHHMAYQARENHRSHLEN